MGSLNRLVHRAWRLLTSARLALVLITLFAAACLLGNLVPQEDLVGAEAVAKWRAANPVPAHLIALLDAHNTFGTPWFIAIAALLAASTLACSVEQIKRALRYSAPPSAPLPGPPMACVPVPVDGVAAALQSSPLLSRLRVTRSPSATGATLVRGSSSVGRWGSVILHLSLVLVFVTVLAGSLTGWSANLVLMEGQAFEPAQAQLHGLTAARLARPTAASALPGFRLVSYSPRYRQPGYDPAGSSVLEFAEDGRSRRVSLLYGRPVTIGGLVMHQTKRYGAVAQVSISRASSPEAPGEPRPGIMPGHMSVAPDGGMVAWLGFVNGVNEAQQRREVYFEPLAAAFMFELVPGPLALEYDRSLQERFLLTVKGPAEARLRVGERLVQGEWEIRFQSLRYWTVLSLAGRPFSAWFLLAGWLLVAGAGLSLVFPPRRIDLDLRTAIVAGRPGCELRYQVAGARGGGLFGARAAEAIARMVEEASATAEKEG